MTKINVKGEWFLQYNNGPWLGPLQNTMTTAGLSRFAQLCSELSSPFIAFGSAGGETFRKEVGAVVCTDMVNRFRISLSLSEGNGSHTWLALYADATANPDSGTKMNHLDQVFSKNQNEVLNIECRFTFQQGEQQGGE